MVRSSSGVHRDSLSTCQGSDGSRYCCTVIHFYYISRGKYLIRSRARHQASTDGNLCRWLGYNECLFHFHLVLLQDKKHMQTVSIIRGFFLAMALHPDISRKARDEIDVVVGTERLPLISDRIHLPYVNALILQLFRWNVVLPNGFHHQTSQDNVHAGYFIPKGSIILPNIQLIHDELFSSV